MTGGCGDGWRVCYGKHEAAGGGGGEGARWSGMLMVIWGHIGYYFSNHSSITPSLFS